MEIVGYTTSDLALAIGAIDSTLGEGESARLRLCTTRLPTDVELANFVVAVHAAGGKTSFPATRIVGDVAVTEMILTKGNPLLLLIPILVPLATIGLVTFGIVKIETISSAIMPILLATGGILLLGIVILAPKAERVAVKYVEAGGKLKYLASTIPEASLLDSQATTTSRNVPIDWRRVKFTGSHWTPKLIKTVYYAIEYLPVNVDLSAITEFRIDLRVTKRGAFGYRENKVFINPTGGLGDIIEGIYHEIGHHLVDTKQITGDNLERLGNDAYFRYLGLEKEASDPAYRRHMQEEFFAFDFGIYCLGKPYFMSAFDSEERYQFFNQLFPYTKEVRSLEWWRDNFDKLPEVSDHPELRKYQAATQDYESRRASATKKLAEWFVERVKETGKSPDMPLEVTMGIVRSYIDRNEIIDFADWFMSPAGVRQFKQELRAAAVIHKLVNFNPDNLPIGHLLDTKIRYVIISNRGDTELMERSNVSLEAFEAANKRAISMGVKPATGYEVPEGYKPDDFGGQYKPGGDIPALEPATIPMFQPGTITGQPGYDRALEEGARWYVLTRDYAHLAREKKLPFDAFYDELLAELDRQYRDNQAYIKWMHTEEGKASFYKWVNFVEWRALEKGTDYAAAIKPQAGFGEISQFVNRPRPTGFRIHIAETSKGGKWEFLGSIPSGLVEPGTGHSLLFGSRDEAVLAAKHLGYEEGKVYSVDTGKELAIPKAEAGMPEAGLQPSMIEESIVKGTLQKSIDEEIRAKELYLARAAYAKFYDDEKTIELYKHVAGEESRHAEEFAKRLSELGSDALEFIPDSPEYLSETIQSAGWRDKIDQAFQAAIQRVRG